MVFQTNNSRQQQKKTTLTRYIQKYPNGWKKRLELGDLLVSMGNLREAVGEYRQVLLKQPNLLTLWLKLARLLEELNLLDEAITAYQKALTLTEHEATIYHIQGLISICQGNYSLAKNLLQKATSLEPQQPNHWLMLGKVQGEIDNPLEAISAYDQVLSIQPMDEVCLSLLYDQLMIIGELNKAGKILEQLQDLNPSNPHILKRFAYHYTQQGFLKGWTEKEMKKLLKHLSQETSNALEYYDIQAHYYRLHCQEIQAIALWEKLTQQFPHQSKSWYYAGNGLWQLGKYEKARLMIEEAYRLSPKSPQIYQSIWQILPYTSSKKRLLSLIDPLLNSFSERWTIWVTVGRVLVEKLGEIEQGCSFSAQGVQLHPKLANPWLYHGRVLLLSKKFSDAVEALSQGWHLLAKDQENILTISALIWLAESYQELGETALSQHWWQKAHQQWITGIADDSKLKYYWQGQIWQGLGEKEKAIAAYQKALTQVLSSPLQEEIQLALNSAVTPSML